MATIAGAYEHDAEGEHLTKQLVFVYTTNQYVNIYIQNFALRFIKDYNSGVKLVTKLKGELYADA